MGTKRRFDPRLLALACVLIGGTGQGVVAPQLPELLGGAGPLALASGLSAAVLYLGIFVSTFRYGRMADEGRSHWLLGPGLILYALSLLALGWAGASGSTAALFLARFIEGLALSAVFVAADFALGRLSAPAERGQWLSYYGVALSAGLLLGPAIALGGPSLGLWLGLSHPTSPAVSLVAVACLATVLGFCALPFRIAQSGEEGGHRGKLPLPALYCGAAYGFLEAGLVAVFPVLAVTEFHVVPEYCLFVVILTAAVSSLFWGWLSDRLRPAPVVRVLLMLLISGPGALVLMGSWLSPAMVVWLSCALFGTLAGGLYPVSFAWLLEAVPESQYGYASGGFARAYGVGSLAGPLVVGVCSQFFGSTGLFLSISFSGAVCATACWRMERVSHTAGG